MSPECFAVLTTCIGAALGFVAAILAEPITRWIYRPFLFLDFTEEPGCKARTPEQILGQPTSPIHEAEYVRIKVANTKPYVATKCRAYLVSVEKADDSGMFHPTIYCDSIPVAWACRGEDRFKGIDIPMGVVQYIDLLSTRSISNEYRIEIETILFRYIDLFRQHGTFMFTIQVSGDNVKPVFIKIIFKWAGLWNKYDAKIA
jgi:hypothetical protein